MESMTSTPASSRDDDLIQLSTHREVTTVKKVLSKEGRMIFEVVNYVTLCTIVSAFGIVANIINIIVFFKQGFSNTVNISLFGLAISDLCCLVSLEWVCICLNPLFLQSGVPWVPEEVQYLSGAWPHVCFSRITSLITAYTTAERCFCIAIPLKVKQVITPKRTTMTVLSIYFLNLATIVPEYVTSYIDWKFYSNRNVTLLALCFTENRKYVEGLVFVMNSTLGMVSFTAVIVFTVVLIVKLRHNSMWRLSTSSFKDRREDISNRDRKTMKMIVLIAIILIICYIPGAIISMATFVVPEFNLLGGYVNICMAVWSFAFLFQAVNSSVNIFLYYAMSSKYRETFCLLFLKIVAPNTKLPSGD